jgi:hypothetical protein
MISWLCACPWKIVVSLLLSGVTFKVGWRSQETMVAICRACQRICFMEDCTCTLCRQKFCSRCLSLLDGDELDRIRLDYMIARRERDEQT